MINESLAIVNKKPGLLLSGRRKSRAAVENLLHGEYSSIGVRRQRQLELDTELSPFHVLTKAARHRLGKGYVPFPGILVDVEVRKGVSTKPLAAHLWEAHRKGREVEPFINVGRNSIVMPLKGSAVIGIDPANGEGTKVRNWEIAEIIGHTALGSEEQLRVYVQPYSVALVMTYKTETLPPAGLN